MLVLLEERKLICGLPSQFAVPIGSPPVHLHSGSNWLVQGTLQVMWHADPFQFSFLVAGLHCPGGATLLDRAIQSSRSSSFGVAWYFSLMVSQWMHDSQVAIGSWSVDQGLVLPERDPALGTPLWDMCYSGFLHTPQIQTCLAKVRPRLVFIVPFMPATHAIAPQGPRDLGGQQLWFLDLPFLRENVVFRSLNKGSANKHVQCWSMTWGTWPIGPKRLILSWRMFVRLLTSYVLDYTWPFFILLYIYK